MAAVLALLAVGALLLFIETLMPGMIIGTVGGICLITAVVLGYVRFGPEVGSFILMGVVAGLLVGAVAWIRFFPKSRAGRMFVSDAKVGNPGYEFDRLRGLKGITQTDLRPSGTALIQGKRYDVVSEGPYLEKGTPIEVLLVEGNRVVVRPEE